jgi:alanyl aminopeptidase
MDASWLMRGCAALTAGLALAACASAPANRVAAETYPADPAPLFADDGMPLGQLSGAVRPTHYILNLKVDPTQTTFSGETTIDVVLNEAADRIWMHGYDLKVKDASLVLPDGRAIKANFAQKNDTGSALLTLRERAPAGPAKLHFVYTAPFNDTSYGMLRQQRDGRWYAVTQFESIAARWVFPSFDEPGFKVPFDVAVTARTGDAVITNSPEISHADAGNGWTRRVFATTKPLPTYLIMFAVGPYDVVAGQPIPPNAVRKNAVPLRAAAVKGLGKSEQFVLDKAGAIVGAHEAYYDAPYPYDKLDLVAMPSIGGFGAMENAGAITFDEYLLVLGKDAPLAQRRSSITVMAHEIAHMWTGDLVTPKWWTDIWLNESFAEWASDKAAKAVWSEGEFDRNTEREALSAMGADSLASARQIRQPVLHDEEIEDTFDSITYEKGAGVLAMLEAYVGEDKFRDGLRLHMQRYAYGNANADDFLRSLADGSGKPEVVGAFHSFIDQPGVPVLKASLACPAHGKPEVRVSQSRYAPLGTSIEKGGNTWRIPACVSYSVNGKSGKTCSLVSAREQTIALDAPGCPDRLVPNADGAGYYRFALDDKGWASLTAHATALSPGEALAAVDSLDAAFRAGDASADAYVAGLASLAKHPAWDVAQAVADRLEDATTILSEDQLQKVRPALAGLFRDRYAQVADAQDIGDVLLKADLARFLALIARDPEVRGGMKAQAAQRIGIRGAADWSAVDRNRLETVLSVGVQELGPRFFDLVLGEATASNDPSFRRAALAALARVEDPKLAARLRDATVAGTFRGGESLTVVSRQLSHPASQAMTWSWVKANGDAVVSLASDAFRSRAVPAIGAPFCTSEMGAEFTAWMRSHAAQVPGYERTLAQTQEQIALCSALRKASAEDLTRALQRLGG